MNNNNNSNKPPYVGVWHIAIPSILLGIYFQWAVDNSQKTVDNFIKSVDNLFLGDFFSLTFCLIIGLVSLYFGWIWYGKIGLGIRAGRPMMSGFSFAFLGWLGMLIARFLSVGWNPNIVGENLGITFIYLLIIQAMCVQLWAFGLLFRLLADSYNPQTAALLSGVAFGLVAYYFYPETYTFSLTVPWAIMWGIMYGVIRLRTGSWLGTAFIQAMQTLSVWYILPPVEPMPPTNMLSFYWLIGISGIAFLFITWRLLPKYKSDLRL